MNRRTALAALPIALTACATTTSWLNNPVVLAALQQAVSVAAGVVLNALGGPALTTAEAIVSDITALISAATGTTVTLTTLQAEADGLIISSTLPPLVQDALLDIIAVAVSSLSASATAGTSGPLSTVFADAQTASQLYLNAARSGALGRLRVTHR